MSKIRKEIEAKAARRQDSGGIQELEKWADTPKKFKLIKSLVEYFDLDSLVLIIRAIDKSKILKD